MREQMTGGKMPKKTTVPSSKRTGDSTPAKKVTVSQATIDKIKSQGMTAALKTAAAGGVSASYMEGVKRMYGAARVAKATSANINAASKPKAYGANNAPKYRPASAAATKAATKPTSNKPAAKPKKSGTSDPFAKFVFGVGKAAAEPFKSKPKK
jgi:hypothetical protein